MSFHSFGAMIEKALSSYVVVLDRGVTGFQGYRSEECRARAGELAETIS